MASSLASSPDRSFKPRSESFNANSQTEHSSQMTTMISTATATKIVERCFLMNLDRREDRLEVWMRQLADPWPFPQPERFNAIDGRRITPAQWSAGNGA